MYCGECFFYAEGLYWIDGLMVFLCRVTVSLENRKQQMADLMLLNKSQWHWESITYILFFTLFIIFMKLSWWFCRLLKRMNPTFICSLMVDLGFGLSTDAVNGPSDQNGRYDVTKQYSDCCCHVQLDHILAAYKHFNTKHHVHVQ